MKKILFRIFSLLVVLALALSTSLAEGVVLQELPAEADIHPDPSNPYKDPTEGYYRCSVDVNGVSRDCVVYEPASSYQKMPTVFIAAPGTVADAQGAAQWLEDTGWSAVSEAEQFRIACIFSGDAWAEGAAAEFDYLEAVRGIIRKRVFWNAASANFYLVGYEGGADVMAYTAMTNPTFYAGLVTFGGSGLSEEAMDFCRTNCIDHEGFLAEDIMRSELDARTWMFVLSADRDNERIQESIAYWKQANDVDDEAFVLSSALSDEIYQEPAFRHLELNENSVGTLWVTYVENADAFYADSVPAQVYTQFLQKAWRFEAYPSCPLRAYEDLVKNGTFTRYTMELDGWTREYYVYCPEKVKVNRNAAPVVVSFHGGGGTGREMIYRSGWYPFAENASFIVVHPTGLYASDSTGANVSWNIGAATETRVDDLSFFKAMLAELSENYPVDASRVYVTGQSMGGLISNAFGVRAPELVAAIACTSGSCKVEQYESMPDIKTDYMIANMMSVGTNDKAEPNMASHELYWQNWYGWSSEDCKVYVNGNFTNHVYEYNGIPLFQWALVEGKLHAPMPEECYQLYEFMSKYSRGEDGTLYYMNTPVEK